MGIYILGVIAVYFGLILLISHLVSRKNSGNESFFLGNRKSPWYIVAIGMLGDSISGATFVAVPGMVGALDMTYMQMVLGFFPGYLIVAFVLLPLYYKLNLVSIYGYLQKRFGNHAYKTGASFFILSRIVGSASKMFLVALILQTIVFDQWNIPFWLTVTGIVVLIWLYTFRSGMRTIVWTDALQTICLLAALVLIVWQVSSKLGFGFSDTVSAVVSSPHSRIFEFDWLSKHNFFKQFLSGILIVIVMTGLDQNMMQKNLTCRSLKDAQKNMVSYGFGFIPMNYLFLSLGVLLLIFASTFNIELPTQSDKILPLLATEYLGLPVLICFAIGIVASSFSNADSALTSLTTSVCVDLLGMKSDDKKSQRKRFVVHLLVSVVFLFTILMINYLGQSNVLDTIYTAASYTYGPLLGMFFFGLFTKLNLRDKLVPLICVLAPILSYILEWWLMYQFKYKVGYEILLINGMLTAVGLWFISIRKTAMIAKG